jgi:hypothetical protein
MITENEFIEDLENLIKKSEILAKTYKSNSIWELANIKLNYILTELKKDKRIYGY